MAIKLRSLLFAALFLGLGFLGFRALSALKPRPEPATAEESIYRVRVVAAHAAARRPLLSVVGDVEARDYAKLTSPVAADVLRVPVTEGQIVRRGERVVELDLRDLLLTRQLDEAAIEDAEAQLEGVLRDERNDRRLLVDRADLLSLAADNMGRDRRLLDAGVIPQSQFDQTREAHLQRKLDYRSAQGRIDEYATQKSRLQVAAKRARAQLEKTKVAIEYARVRAPFAAKIARVKTAAGARVAAGEPLVELFNVDSMRLVAALPREHAANLRAQAAVSARIKGADADLSLTLSGFAPVANPGQGSVDAYFDLPPGLWVVGDKHEIDVALPPVANAFALPFETLYDEGKIYRIDSDRRARAVSCKILGLTAGEDSAVEVALLDCPRLVDGEKIVATRVPNLVEGALLQALD